MPLWSKSARQNSEKPARHHAEHPPAPQAGAAETAEAAADSLRPWLRMLGSHAGTDTLLHFAQSPGNSIDLTHAHPSGLTQLLTGRRTRLSTLLRDPGHYTAAMRAARVLRAKMFEMGSERGLDVGYLAAGTATWRAVRAGAMQQMTAPVMLAPVALTVRPSQDDYELQLSEQARLNPALVRHLRTEQRIGIDPDAVARLAYSTARFEPHPVLERLRSMTENVRGMSIEHRILVSTFADLVDAGSDPALGAPHPVLSALAARAEPDYVPSVPEVRTASFTPVDERDPADELLVLDADPAQQEVLDLVKAGESLVVSAPPGTGQTQTAINAAATLASEGKSVLVVAERRRTLHQFVEQLDALGLGSVVLQVSANISDQQLKDQLVRAIVRNEKAEAPSLNNLHRTLVEHRHQLQDHVKSLHNVRPRWGCSPYQAMQSLAELTALDPAPATTVRLKRSVLDGIKDRGEVTVRLRRAAQLGSFSNAAAASPWYGAKLLNRKETEEAHRLTSDLARDLPQLREKMERVAEHSEIGLGLTFHEWGEQLELLVAVRGSLDKFTPDIFDRPVTDLISATAPSAWRRERGVEMSAMTRSRLRRVAKEYVRPGVHISDLHTSLLDVQQQRTLWSQYATTQRHPSVPTGLAEISGFYLQTQQHLETLSGILAQTPGGGNLESARYEDLVDRLNELAADKQTLTTLPERTMLLEQLRDQGLGELLDDLSGREVAAPQVGSELELAWWQSALEAMISGDEYLAMSDGEHLRQLEAEYRLADNAHIASGSGRLRWQLAERWREAVAHRPVDAASLRELLKDGNVSLRTLSNQADEMVSALIPVWAVSPLVLPTVLPPHKTFDAVLILEAEAISLASAVPAIGRARQVIAFGDGRLAGPQPFSVGTEPASDTGEQQLESAFGALTKVLPCRELNVVYRGVDQALIQYLNATFYDGRLSRLPDARALAGAGRALTVEYIADGTGMPTADRDGVESVAAEVNRAVDLVFEHVRRRPRQSLAVVTAGVRHAARLAEAIRLQMANHPWAADFFKPGRESFRVVPVEHAAGLVRDCIIFSLGFGRTPHGRALHNFGSLSGPDGRGLFVTAMTRARNQLHVLTCFTADDLDPERLGNGALDFYELLRRELGDDAGLGASLVSAAEVNEDPLVADLVGRLRRRGANVWDHYNGVLDIVAAPDPLTAPHNVVITPMAIESDGTQRYRTASVRERSRLRPQLLERLGWRYMPLWTIEVFTDPSGCANLIGGYLGLPAPKETEEPLHAANLRKAQAAGHTPGPSAGVHSAGVPSSDVPSADADGAEDAPAAGTDTDTDNTGSDNTGSENTDTDNAGMGTAGSAGEDSGSGPAIGTGPARTGHGHGERH
jgi:hypothetical protein